MKGPFTFEIKGWDEKPYDEGPEDIKLVRAHYTKAYQGTIEGEGTVEMLMMYGPQGAVFAGFERVVGKVSGRAGSFVIQHDGIYVEGKAKGAWRVVSGSGTGDLRGLQGTADFDHGNEESYVLTLDYAFA